MTSARSSDLFCLKKMFFFVYQFSFNDLGAKRRDFFPPFLFIMFFHLQFYVAIFLLSAVAAYLRARFCFCFYPPRTFLKKKKRKTTNNKRPFIVIVFCFFLFFFFPIRLCQRLIFYSHFPRALSFFVFGFL